MNSYTEIYNISYRYLQEISPVCDLEKYFVGDQTNPQDLETVFRELIRTAQDYQRMPNVIKFCSREPVIKKMLHDYDLGFIASLDSETLYYLFRKEFGVTTKDSKMNSWYKWSCSVIDSAKFVNQFESVEGFKAFVNEYQNDATIRAALPLLIANKIRGVGFALACNALKELGNLKYVKPDVHLMDICEELQLSKRAQIDVFEVITKIAEENGVEPYKVDKVLWLICSGNFYKDNIKIESHKAELIRKLKALDNT